MLRGRIKKVQRWNGEYIWIENRDGYFVAYKSYPKAILGCASPSSMDEFDQETLKQAFESEFLNH